MMRRYQVVRDQTLALIRGLSAEDCCAQSMPEASPTKWHLAHTSWFFETFVLEKYEKGFTPFNPHFRDLFNSYYESVGPIPSRPDRGLMTRPSLQEILDYRGHVDERMLVLMTSPMMEEDLITRIEWGLQHEQQHQELILSDIKHLLFQNPLRPPYRPGFSNLDAPPPQPPLAQPIEWFEHEGGLAKVGAPSEGFYFDNEAPRHTVWLEPFKLCHRLVTNQEFRAFIDDGGYDDPRLWLSEGWAECNKRQLRHPLYWQKMDQEWLEFTLEGNQPLNPIAPVLHVSYFEADAFARWAGYRLPTEFEWEQIVTRERFGEPEISAIREDLIPLMTALEKNAGFSGFFRLGWQWTQSSYAPYPGYRPLEGALGEYNGKFMINQQVLRGGSCATPLTHTRVSYRNFYPAASRWAFSAIRLASSL